MEDGQGFSKNYNLGMNENYYIQYTENPPTTTFRLSQMSTSTIVTFTKDVKVSETKYKSHKFLALNQYNKYRNTRYGMQ